MDTFEIVDGVRRAKAAQLLGLGSIWAVIADTEIEFRVVINTLRSPRSSIYAQSQTSHARWESVFSAMATEPDLLPPIVIRLGDRGVLIADVIVRL
ncbi:ParB N-terminal domain-containing protein [Humisphaera borealis]|uniref:ParB/Sulfiredoxin domain-containing protein n=1 Tax=Humisphaera borealis TaxID=2807512 RepID=A0A7M2WT02_9BACT|nr:ParB N-terminal domain-containing protein [Humisphaera borealis]QOV88637.1 hypothetical protein IPV69_20710 [Humisphaera borealis]